MFLFKSFKYKYTTFAMCNEKQNTTGKLVQDSCKKIYLINKNFMWKNPGEFF